MCVCVCVRVAGLAAAVSARHFPSDGIIGAKVAGARRVGAVQAVVPVVAEAVAEAACTVVRAVLFLFACSCCKRGQDSVAKWGSAFHECWTSPNGRARGRELVAHNNLKCPISISAVSLRYTLAHPTCGHLVVL